MLAHRKHFPNEVSALVWPGLGLKVKAKALITRPKF